MVLISFSRLISRNVKSIQYSSMLPSSDMAKLREIIKKSQRIVILTGAGASAESGVQTFRGTGGWWRSHSAVDLATPEAFYKNPSLVWEFYHHRREVMATKLPNKAHKAIAEAQALFKAEGRRITVITQNIDELHHAAGTEKVLELHGSLFRTRCIDCGVVKANRDSPICEALRGKGDSKKAHPPANIPKDQLPRCSDCKGLLRPDVIWFGEMLNDNILDRARAAADRCDLLLLVGTSSLVQPASLFAPTVASDGGTVAEFNIEVTRKTHQFGFFFEGPCGETLPIALAP